MFDEILIGAGVFAFAAVILYWYLRSRSRRKPYYRDKIFAKAEEPHKIVYSVFLIGDAGAPSLEMPEPALRLLQLQLQQAQEKSAVAFLGDLIYPKGLPPPDDKLRPISEKRLNAQLDILKNYRGRCIFISGNHDWNKNREGGWEYVQRQEAYVEEYLNKGNTYLPDNGCPGPVELNLTEDITAIVINTQWWIQKGKIPVGKKDGCTVENEEEFFVDLQQILDRNKEKKLVVLGHLPLYSYSFHGGKFPIKHHLFPLTAAKKKLYIPFPGVGSLYPLYRKYLGARVDMAHPLYKSLKKRLVKIFKRYPNLIYAAGHDHNLQYICKKHIHYIVSGAGCKVTYVRKGKKAYFTHAHKGFFRINYFNDGAVWMEVWEPEGRGETAVLMYSRRLE